MLVAAVRSQVISLCAYGDLCVCVRVCTVIRIALVVNLKLVFSHFCFLVQSIKVTGCYILDVKVRSQLFLFSEMVTVRNEGHNIVQKPLFRGATNGYFHFIN